MATQALAVPPVMVADAGFMYVAKMSGYADAYDLFTPDLGELAFLADEKAPHPFYTRGFLLAREDDVPPLLQRALEHGNCPKNLIIKGSKDYIVVDGRVIATVDAPSVPAMISRPISINSRLRRMTRPVKPRTNKIAARISPWRYDRCNGAVHAPVSDREYGSLRQVPHL